MEKLEVEINNRYEGTELVSTARVVDGDALISEWTPSDHRALIHSGIDASEPNVFEQLKIKKTLDKCLSLFEVEKVTIEPKEK